MKRSTKRPNVFRRSLGFETLENRSVMAGGLTATLTQGVLNVTGTSGNDTIVLRQSKDKIAIDGVATTFAAKSVTSIKVDGGAGDDRIQLDTLNPVGKVYDKPITVNGSGGNDSVRGTNGKDVFFNTGRKVTIDAKGTTLLDGKAPTWADTNIRDEALRQLVNTNLVDKVLDRTDMLGIFKQTSKDGKVAANEFEDLKAIATTTSLFGTLEYVGVLTKDVVLGNVANKTYAGAALGNLAAGSSSAQLEKLVGKWFLGTDRPNTTVNGSTFQYTVANGKLFGAAGPQYSDVNQGYVGDCYFVGALGEIALKSKADIQNMFIVNGDGTYTVRFYNAGKADYVTVDSQLPVTQWGTFVFANMGQQIKSAANVLWVALAEKAYVQMNEAGWLRASGGLPGNGVNSYNAISGGYMSDAIKQVCNRQANNYNLEKTGDALAAAFTSGKMVGIGTKSTVTNPALVGGHQYVVVGYDATTKKFTLFNPWGVNNGSKPGLVQLSWADIQANFSYSTRTV